MTQDPMPQRLSDADRDSVVDALRTHLEAGRLDQSEFEERMGKALTARVAADVAPLFTDLPLPHPTLSTGDGWADAAYDYGDWAPTPSPIAGEFRPRPPGWAGPWPGGQGAPGTELQPRPSGGPLASLSPSTISILRTWTWPAAILIGIITGNWVTIPIAIVITVLLSQLGRSQRRKPPPYLER